MTFARPVSDIPHLPLWFPWWYVNSRSRSRHIHRKHVHPHLDATLLTRAEKDFTLISVSFITPEKKTGLFPTCSMPGLSGFSRGLVSTCSGTSLQPTRSISSQWFSTVRARCSSVCFFRPEIWRQAQGKKTNTLVVLEVLELDKHCQCSELHAFINLTV